MKNFVCDTCGYVYNPAEGDPDNGIEPGTPFEELPDEKKTSAPKSKEG